MGLCLCIDFPEMSPFRSSLPLPPSEFAAFGSSWWVHGCSANWDQINKGLMAQHQPESHIQPKFSPSTTFLQLPQASMSCFSHMSDCTIGTLSLASWSGPLTVVGQQGTGSLTCLMAGCWGSLRRLGGVETRLSASVPVKEAELSTKTVSPGCDISDLWDLITF